MDFQAILTELELRTNKGGNLSEDIKQEQAYITWADEISIIYPLWWNAFPAILKGYIDRVFTNGFAFKVNGKGPEGLLQDKKVRLITSAGMSEQALLASNIYKGLEITQDIGVFKFCGMKMLGHHYITNTSSLSDEEKQGELEKLGEKIFNGYSL